MPLFVSRVPTVLSLQQLADDEKTKIVSAGIIHEPERKVVEIQAGAKLPSYRFALTKSWNFKTIRSFGELPFTNEIENFDNPQSSSFIGDESYCLSGSSSDNEESVGPSRSSSRSPAPVVPFIDPSSPSQVEMYPTVIQPSVLDMATMKAWEERQEQGLLRYPMSDIQTKMVPGNYGFIVQFNEGRLTKKRPTEFRVDQVVQDFDDTKFNFKKAFQKELLYTFTPDVPTTLGKPRRMFLDVAEVQGTDNLHAVFINVSPVEKFHVILCPSVLNSLPQLATPDTVLLALLFASEYGNPYFRLGFNTLGAYATINHLHFQGYQLNAAYPVERAPTMRIKDHFKKGINDSVEVYELQKYPVRGLVFEWRGSSGGSVQDLARAVGNACIKLRDMAIPHNMMICDCGARVFLWPQCYSKKQALGQVPEELLETGMNPACFELCGHIIVKRVEDYQNLTEEFVWRLLAETSLEEDEFQRVLADCLDQSNM
eukprot:TRINITY_DN910_c0_g1_i1.p2 TRINITY_DN910_c0_g1~~TRINITY_DN910_c0_g1_i1.p2  ORF type:complete len:484 (-),score=65.59 TRINITY_DN910_c0_g1_i1:198-1649(-)